MELKNLEEHVHTLATLDETDSPVVSCYLDLSRGVGSYRDALDGRVRMLRDALSGQQGREFERALGRIESFLSTDLSPDAKGAALFARAGAHSFFLPLQFRVPLPNWVAVGPSPNIYHLCELKDVYHRYVVLLVRRDSARILEVNLGAVTKELWQTRSDLRQRVGRGWSREHRQAHRKERIKRFLKERVKVLERVMSKGGYTHLILAGDPRIVSQAKKLLPKALTRKLVDMVTAAGNGHTDDVVVATLSAFVEREERASQAMVEVLQRRLHTSGLAAVGTRDTYDALRRGQAETLVMAETYEPASRSWHCWACGAMAMEERTLHRCPDCGRKRIRPVDLKEEMLRLAERTGCAIETVPCSELLTLVGGVGCLLRYLTLEQHYERAHAGWASIQGGRR